MKTYKQIKRVLKIGEKEVAEAFGLRVSSLANSTAKQRYRKGIERMYQMFENADRNRSVIEKPDMSNLLAWVLGHNLNVFQKADAVIEFNKIMDFVDEMERVQFKNTDRTPYPKESDYGEKYSPYLHRDDLINWIENNKH